MAKTIAEQREANNLFTQKFSHDFDLTEKEGLAFSSYLADKGKDLNWKILTNALDSETKEMYSDLASALSKLPTVSDIVVYRNFDFYEDQAARALKFFTENVGSIVEFQTFLSTTKLDNFTGRPDPDVLIAKIYTANNSGGVCVPTIKAKYGAHQTEEEVLYNVKSKFLVESVDPTSDFKIILKEQSEASQVVPVPRF